MNTIESPHAEFAPELLSHALDAPARAWLYRTDTGRLIGWVLADERGHCPTPEGADFTLTAPPVDNPEPDHWRFDGQNWQPCEATPITPAVPSNVTMRQARLALLAAGHLGEVTAAIDQLPEPQKSAAKIEWEYAASVERQSDFVAQMGQALGLDDAQLDALFTAAAAL